MLLRRFSSGSKGVVESPTKECQLILAFNLVFGVQTMYRYKKFI